MYVSIFSITFVGTFFILRTTERDVIKNIYWPSCKVLVMYFSRQFFYFRKILICQISCIIRSVVAELFHADGRTDRHDEANRRFFLNFANAPQEHVTKP